MRSWLGVAFLLWALHGLLRADSIHLKNGTTIVAESITESNDKVAYTVGDAQYSIPKSVVSRIEHGSGFGISIATSRSGWVPAPTHPATHISSTSPDSKVTHRELTAALPKDSRIGGVESSAISARVINSFGVNERALRDLEEEGNAEQTTAGYFMAARYAYEHSDSESARRYMKHCVELQPDEAALREWYAILLLDAGQSPDAVVQAERAVKQQPNSADALDVLGLAYYDAGRFEEAMENWKRGQQLHPNGFIASMMEKAKRESAVEANFNEREGTHFILRYEGRQTSVAFASELLASLEHQYISLQRDLGAPEITITVILYTEHQFANVTEAPSWSEALNDGKIRIPVRNLSGVTPQLETVLRHEMTHSFVHALTRGQCPTWLNEGIAQMEEPRSSSGFAEPLAQLFRAGKAVPLRDLEGSFMQLTPQQAALAYAESLAAVEYLRSNYGMLALRRMLDSLNDGDTTEAALRSATHVGYAEFESGIAGYLASR